MPDGGRAVAEGGRQAQDHGSSVDDRINLALDDISSYTSQL